MSLIGSTVLVEDETQNRANSLASLARQGEQLRANLRKPLSIESKRIALERKITLDFPHFKGFLTEYSHNISMTGMFVRSERPEPSGTVLAFEFRLADGLNLIRGQAEVVWRRMNDGGPSRPPGMGLSFVRLDKESRRLIRWAVEKNLREGGASFVLDENISDEEVPGAAARAVSETHSVDAVDLVHPGARDEEARAKLHPYAGAAAAKSGLATWQRIAYPVIAILLAVGLAALTFRWRDGETAGKEELTAGAPAAGVPAAGVPAAGVPAAGVPAAGVPVAAAPAPTDLEAESNRPPSVLDMVEDWARAWSEQRVDDYLSCYSTDYRPADGMSREEWSALRRQRIERPRRIEVQIREVEAELLKPGRSRVSFLQSYASDTYRDTNRKVLDLVFEDDRWKILGERSG